jgi:uncharacterized protein YwgA
MKKFKYYKEFNEGYGYVKDPFRQGTEIFQKQIMLGDDIIVKVEGHVDGKDDAHTAIVSIITIPVDTFGEDLGKERFIVHQKDFDDEEKATEYIKKMEGKLSFQQNIK